jgi:hypothetical protein
MIRGADTRDIEQVPLGVVDLLQVGTEIDRRFASTADSCAARKKMMPPSACAQA